MNTGVAAEAAVGWHQMRRISDEENALVLKFLCYTRRGAPAGKPVDPHRQVRHAHAGADERYQLTFAYILRNIECGLWIALGVAEDIHGEEPRLAGAIHPEKPGQRRVIYIDDAPGVVTNPR